MLTRDRKIMGSLVNRPATTVLAIIVATAIFLMNFLLLYQTFGGQFPGAASGGR
jgi:manganese transport protein